MDLYHVSCHNANHTILTESNIFFLNISPLSVWGSNEQQCKGITITHFTSQITLHYSPLVNHMIYWRESCDLAKESFDPCASCKGAILDITAWLPKSIILSIICRLSVHAVKWYEIFKIIIHRAALGCNILWSYVTLKHCSLQNISCL